MSLIRLPAPRATVALAAAAIAVLGGLAASAAPKANLIQNGSFEDGVCTGDFHLVNAGDSSTIPGWEVFAGDVHWVCNNAFWQSSDGSRDLDLDGSVGSNGAVRQTFSTQIGSTYRVTFRMAANNYNPPAVKTMDVSVAGLTHDFEFDTTGILPGELEVSDWETHTITFVASSETSTLSFVSTTSPAGWGPAVDDVRVELVSPSAIPTTSRWGNLIMLLALGTSLATSGELRRQAPGPGLPRQC